MSGGAPWQNAIREAAFLPAGPEDLDIAFADATILHSTDGGASWEEYFTP